MTKPNYLLVGMVVALASSASADQFDDSHDACMADPTLICSALFGFGRTFVTNKP